MLKKAIIGALLLLAISAGADSVDAQSQDAPDGDTAAIELRVWQHVRDAERIYVSARPVGGDWRTLGTIPLPLDDGYSSDESCRYGDFTVAGGELRVWQHVRNAERIYVSAHPAGGDCRAPGAIPLPLDDGHSSSGSYRYGNLTIAVPSAAPGATPAVAVSPGGAAVPRLATVQIAFRDPPREADGGQLVSINPPAEGSFVWADDHTLLFQPAFPGWQRGQQYRLRVDADAAGIAADHAHTFTVEGQLAVSYVIPGDGDREVPTTAQILVQFNRSVAPLTVLQEGPAAAVLEFDPPLAGRGEWLNTSLYRFIPTDLQPSAEYAVRVPAGLTSAAEGVLASDFAWSFATVQPAITSFTPGDNSVHVEPDDPVVIAFNQPMNRVSVEAGLALRDAGRRRRHHGLALEWGEDGTAVTLRPAENPLTLGAARTRSSSRPGCAARAAGGDAPPSGVASFAVDRTAPARANLPGGTVRATYTGTTGTPSRLEYNNPLDVGLVRGPHLGQRSRRRGTSACDLVPAGAPETSPLATVPACSYSTAGTPCASPRGRARPRGTCRCRPLRVLVRHGGAAAPASVAEPSPSPASFVDLLGERASRCCTTTRGSQMDEVRFRLYRLSDPEAETLLRRGLIDGWDR